MFSEIFSKTLKRASYGISKVDKSNQNKINWGKLN